MTQPRMPKTATPLSRRLEAAFVRLDPATPVPPWPRSVRIGVDYSLRVTGMNPATDREADSLAYACFALGNLAERDPKGDPPASSAAQERARRGGGRLRQILRPARPGARRFSRVGAPRLGRADLGGAHDADPAAGRAR
jgi:hypothetical protein